MNIGGNASFVVVPCRTTLRSVTEQSDFFLGCDDGANLLIQTRCAGADGSRDGATGVIPSCSAPSVRKSTGCNGTAKSAVKLKLQGWLPGYN